MPRLFRWFAALLVLGGGAFHLSLYLDGYRAVPKIGPLFLVQAAIAVVVAVALVLRPAGAVGLAGAVLSAGSIAAFLLSRTAGFLGFVESGFDTRSAATLAVEVLTLSVLGLWFVSTRPLPQARPIVGARRGDELGQAA